MERADTKILSAFATLHGNADFEVVLEWLRKSRDADVNTLLITKEDAQLRWLQGSIQTLSKIIEVSDEATGIMHRKRTE
jgi:hypothetical protein